MKPQEDCYIMKSNTSEKVVIGVYFSFEELNSMALLNAVFYLSKQRNESLKFVAYVPPGFKCLAFEADLVIEYPEEVVNTLYSNYAEVNDYIVREPIRDRFSKLILWLAKKLNIKGRSLEILLYVTATPRAREYFYRSGLFKWAKQDLRARHPASRHVDFVVHDYVELDVEHYTPKLTYPSLMQSFERRFHLLRAAILDGMTMKRGGGGESNLHVC